MAALSDLRIEIAAKRFPAVGKAREVLALSAVHLSARHGEFVCVTGPSGCGKTTLLNIIAGLDRDFEGRMVLPKPPGRSEPVIGYVFQDPRLLPWYTVRQNIDLVLSPAQRTSGVVEDLLAAAGLERVQDVYPQRLSLGMSRRVSLIRAFAVQPDLLLLDEPFVSLDAPTAQRLRILLLDILARRPTTVLFVTHDLREAIFLAERIVLLSSAPGTMVADEPVPLSRAARNDPAALEAFRGQLAAAHPLLSAELLTEEDVPSGNTGPT